MTVAGREPPPFFRRGPAPLARLAFFVIVSLVLLGVDLRQRYLEPLRQALTVAIYPLRTLALAPVQALREAGGYLAAHGTLRRENARLAEQTVRAAATLLRHEQLELENRQLRSLLAMRDRQPAKGVVAEVLYATRDPYSRKVVIDKGTRQAVRAGQVVIDDLGVIGQVTRAFPLTAEVTLITDREQAVPVQVRRNALRAVLFGAGDGLLELRYLAGNADVREGDELVTSGLDGIYLPGLPVGRVTRLTREDKGAFARIFATPIAGVERDALVLVLGERVLPAAPPRDAVTPGEQRPARARAGRK